MKKNRVTIELVVEVPASVNPEKIFNKFFKASDTQKLHIVSTKALKTEDIGEVLLPYEQRRGEQYAVRKLITDILKAKQIPLAVRVGTDWGQDYWYGYNTKAWKLKSKRADLPMALEFGYAANTPSYWPFAVVDNLEFTIEGGQIFKGRKLIDTVANPTLDKFIAYIEQKFPAALKRYRKQCSQNK